MTFATIPRSRLSAAPGILLAVFLCGCTPAPRGPTITPGVAKGTTFLVRRVEHVIVGAHDDKTLVSLEETLVEAHGSIPWAVKVWVLEQETRHSAGGDVEHVNGLGGGTHAFVRPRGEGVEVVGDPEGTLVGDETVTLLGSLYRFLGHGDPFVTNAEPGPFAPGAKVPGYERALASYLIGKDETFQRLIEVRSRVLSTKPDVVSIHAELSLEHTDASCTWTATPRATFSIRRTGGDLAHLELRGPLSGKCDGEPVTGTIELTVDRAAR